MAAAAVAIKPLSEWSEDQLWAMFMLVDGLHDYGDIGGTRSTQGAYDWYVSQPIPTQLMGTYQVAPGSVQTVKAYAETLFGLRELKSGTGVEAMLTNMLHRGLPKRMGVGGTPSTGTPTDLVDFALAKSGIHYELPLDRLIGIVSGDATVRNRFINVCKALRHIRLDKSGDRESYPNLADFFKGVVGAGESYTTNFDASPGFYKLLLGGTQQFTPLNVLDSAGASTKLSPNDALATYVPIHAPGWTYNTQFMTLAREGEGAPLFTIRIANTADTLDHPLRIEVTYGGATISDTITNTFDNKQYVSGPTLGYIARMIAWIQSQTVPITQETLTTAIAATKGDRNIYTLHPLLERLLPNIPVENQKEHLCRFLSDWKGYGDAEQVRFMAETLASIAAGGAITEHRSQPGKPFIGGTVDENSHQQMTLRGITHGYAHYKYYDFSIVPSVPPTPGQLMYARLNAVISRISTILNFVSKLGGADATIADLIWNLDAGIAELSREGGGAAAGALPQFNPLLAIGMRNAEILKKLKDTDITETVRQLLIHKFKNARQFLDQAIVRVRGAGELQASINVFSAPVFATSERFDGLVGLATDEAVAGFMISVTQLPGRVAAEEEMSIGTFVEQIETYLDGQQGTVNDCKTILPILLRAGPRLDLPTGGGDTAVPVPYIQTQVLSVSVGDQVFKQNTTIAFDPKYLLQIVANLDVLFLNFHSPDLLDKAMQRITKSLYDFLTSFYVPDGTTHAAFKESVDTQMSTFRSTIMDACDIAREELNRQASARDKASSRDVGKRAIISALNGQLEGIVRFVQPLVGGGAEEADGGAGMEGGGQRGGAVVSFSESIDKLIELARGLTLQVGTGVEKRYDILQIPSTLPAAAAAVPATPPRGSGKVVTTPATQTLPVGSPMGSIEDSDMTPARGRGRGSLPFGGRRRTYRKQSGHSRSKTYKKHL